MLAATQARSASLTLSSDLTVDSVTVQSAGQFYSNGYNIAVASDVVVLGSGTIDASHGYAGNARKPTRLTLGGNFTLLPSSSIFVASDSKVAFNGSSPQTVNTLGQAFATIIDSNTSSGGIIFASSWTATNLIATGLTGPTTMYFAGNSTYTITNLMLAGSAGNMVVLRSTSTNTSTYFHIGSTDTVTYVDVQDNNASGGDNILATDGTSANSGNNQNWIFTRLNGNFFLLME
jgi:hypothetical protein